MILKMSTKTGITYGRGLTTEFMSAYFCTEYYVKYKNLERKVVSNSFFESIKRNKVSL